MKQKIALILLAVLICGSVGAVTLFKYRAPNYYMDQVINVINKPSASVEEIQNSFECLDKVRAYVSDKELIMQRADELAESAEKKGIIQAREMQINLIRKILSEEPGNWHAWEMLTRILAERGDIEGITSVVASLDGLIKVSDDDWNYCIKTAQLFAVASSIPWLQSEAYLNLNKSPSAFIEKTAVYSQAIRQIETFQHDLMSMIGADPSLKKVPPASLVSAAQIATEDALGETEIITHAEKFNLRMSNEDKFKKAVITALEGNVFLANKKYSDARIKFRSAIAQYPMFPDAKKQSAETDFQEGVYLLAAEASQARAKRLLRGAYESLSELVDEADAYGPIFPFVQRDKFSGETWCLKAAVISAMRTTYSPNNKEIKALEKEFKEALDQALKLNPNSRLAKEMLDRYSKDGF